MNTKAPAKRARARAATPAPAAPADDTAALRKQAATTRLGEADTAMKALRAAVRAGDADAVRAAADNLAGAATGTRRLYSVRRSSGPIGPRSVPGQGEYVAVGEDGTVVRDSAYAPSLKRDVILARNRVKAGEGREDRGFNRPADAVLTTAKVMTRAEHAAAGS
jgi:hypothetical protein